MPERPRLGAAAVPALRQAARCISRFSSSERLEPPTRRPHPGVPSVFRLRARPRQASGPCPRQARGPRRRVRPRQPDSLGEHGPRSPAPARSQRRATRTDPISLAEPRAPSPAPGQLRRAAFDRHPPTLPARTGPRPHGVPSLDAGRYPRALARRCNLGARERHSHDNPRTGPRRCTLEMCKPSPIETTRALPTRAGVSKWIGLHGSLLCPAQFGCAVRSSDSDPRGASCGALGRATL